MKTKTLIILIHLVIITQGNLFSQTWVKKQDFPDNIGRENAVSFNINGEFYTGTGYGTSFTRDFYKYNPVTNTWTNIPSVPSDSRTNAIGFSLNGKGYCGTGNLATQTPSNDFYEYNPQSLVWTQKASVGLSSLESSVAFVLNGKAYVSLGTTNNNFFTPNYNTNTYEYNPTSNTWSTVGSWPSNFGPGLRGASTFILNNKAYVYGGNTIQSDGFRYSGSELIEFTSAYQWNFIGQAPSNNNENARSDAAIVTTANSAYFIGGYFTCQSRGFWECYTKKVLKWYQPTNSWTELTSEYPEGYYSAGIGINNCGKNYVALGGARTSSAGGTETITKSLYQYQLPADNIITGTSIVCNSNTNFVVQNPDNTSVNWTVSSNLLIVSGQGTNTLTVKQNGTANGSGSITPTLIYCNNNDITIPQKVVWVGVPNQPGAVNGETSPSIGGIYNYVSSAPSVGAAYHDWLMPYGGNPVWSVAGGTVSGPINTLTPNFMVGSSIGFVQVFGSNICGNSAVSKLRVTPTGGGGGGQQQRIQAFPNPAQEELIIFDASLSEDESITLQEDIDFVVTLINSENKKVRQGNSFKGKLILDLHDLPIGFYYLQIQKGKEQITNRIQIKR